MAAQEDFTTPVGRLVQGDCFVPQTKNQQGQPLLDKNGQPTQKYFVAVAFSKSDPAFAAIKAQFERISRAAFPQFFQGPGGACTHPSFSMKIVDGDGIDNNGKPNNTKEGFAGHWILRASSTYPPKCFAAGKYAAHEQLQMTGGLNPIPRGHYVRLAGTVSDNGGGNGKPGLYVNCNLIEWSRVGDVIVSGPDAAQVFGGGAPAPAYGTPPIPGNMAPPPPPVQAPVVPHTAILTGPQMTAKATASYAQYIAAGWTDAAMIADGLMLAPNPAAPGSVAPPPHAPTVAAPPPPPAAVGRRMGPNAQGFTYEQWLTAGYNDAAMIAQGILLA